MTIPVKEVNLNGKTISIIPDYFVESYLGMKKGDVALKMSRPKYKKDTDYLELVERSRTPSGIIHKNFIGLTLFGLNEYFYSLREHNRTEEREFKYNKMKKALSPHKPINNLSLNIYDIIKDDNFEIDYIVDLLSDVIDIPEQEILEIIDGKYKVKAEMCMRNVNGKATPSRLLYVSKDALKCILSELLNQERINKEELMYIMRKIIFVQSSVESCA